MKPRLAAALPMTVLALYPFGVAAEKDSRSLFDGKTLNGWSAPDPGYWSVADGAITARSTPEKPCTTNQFLVWQGGEVADFELKLKFRIRGDGTANSGIQIRSRILPDGHAVGYQADIDRAGQWVGALYDEHGRGVLAKRGERTEIAEDGKKTITQAADPARLFQALDLNGWNAYQITARGHHIVLKINGKTTAEVVDRQKDHYDSAGKLALQLHSGPAMTVQFKDLRLKKL